MNILKTTLVAITTLALSSVASAGSASVHAGGAGTTDADWTNWIYMGNNKAPTVTFEIYLYLYAGGISASGVAVVTEDPYYTYVDEASEGNSTPGTTVTETHHLDAGDYILLGASGGGSTNPLALWYSDVDASW